mmetsp:Transcript_44723/g.95440  ORF Transcript_44723/g.95440 Transcript_44723/m.95440 type:complete len:267 (+) Transcript_44723:921-1721(+)
MWATLQCSYGPSTRGQGAGVNLQQRNYRLLEQPPGLIRAQSRQSLSQHLLLRQPAGMQLVVRRGLAAAITFQPSQSALEGGLAAGIVPARPLGVHEGHGKLGGPVRVLLYGLCRCRYSLAFRVHQGGVVLRVRGLVSPQPLQLVFRLVPQLFQHPDNFRAILGAGTRPLEEIQGQLPLLVGQGAGGLCRPVCACELEQAWACALPQRSHGLGQLGHLRDQTLLLGLEFTLLLGALVRGLRQRLGPLVLVAFGNGQVCDHLGPLGLV